MTTDEPMTCPRCGQAHDRCKGHNRAGLPCRLWPLEGQEVCGMHGGRSPRALAAAERRLEAAAAQEQVRSALAEAFAGQVPDIDPAEAMLSAVSWKYSEVVFLRNKVAGLSEKEMTWGKTRVKTGGDDYGTTKEVKPNIWWQMLRSAEEQLVRFAAAARSAGCDERRVQLAEQQGLLLAGVVRRIVERFYQALVDLLGDEHAAALAAVDAAWAGWVAEIVPGEFRAIETGEV